MSRAILKKTTSTGLATLVSRINFLRSHLRRPELSDEFRSPQDVVKYQKLLRLPAFVIARKQEKFWKITEKVFSEELL